MERIYPNIKLLGNSNYYTIRNTYPLDNSYLYSFVIYGVLFTISLIGIYTYYIYKNVIDNNSKIIAICSIFLIYSFGENENAVSERISAIRDETLSASSVRSSSDKCTGLSS